MGTPEQQMRTPQQTHLNLRQQFGNLTRRIA
jgi:hypothetical protein